MVLGVRIRVQGRIFACTYRQIIIVQLPAPVALSPMSYTCAQPHSLRNRNTGTTQCHKTVVKNDIQLHNFESSGFAGNEP